MINNVVLVGNLTRDVETKQTANSTVAKFGLALNRKFKDKEETTYVDIECWGKTAELVGQYCSKGRQVAITGRLKTDSWEDKDGNKRSKVLVVAEDVRFIGKGADAPKKQEAEETSDGSVRHDDDVPF